VVEERGQVAVPGLGGDPIDRGAVDGGGGGMPGAQRVATDPEAAESGCGSAVADEVAPGILEHQTLTQSRARDHNPAGYTQARITELHNLNRHGFDAAPV
jgi:hypothetical protein